MRSDAVIKKEGFQALSKKLDLVEAERFIVLIKRENFDYTEWRKDLWGDMGIEELSAKAMKHYKRKN